MFSFFKKKVQKPKDDKRQSEQQTECPDIPSLEKIDTSFWKTKDKVWKEERQDQWPAIERVVKGNRRKSEVKVIKQYFLRGKMPRWEAYQDWHELPRHLDLKIFLWLHPSSDLNVLKPLYKLYMESNLIHWLDVTSGFGSFLQHEFIMAPSANWTIEEYPFPYMGDKNIVLFRIMFGDLDYAKKKIETLVVGKKDFENKEKYIFEFNGYHHFFRIGEWLLQDQDSPFCKNCLYQYDDVLEWCLTTLTKDKENEFRSEIEISESIKVYQKGLYQIHNFNTQKEGDTCRTRFVHKIRKILDEREFISEFKQMWEDVKADKIEVKDPWQR